MTIQEKMYAQLTESGKSLVDKKKTDLANGAKFAKVMAWFFVLGSICEFIMVITIPFMLFTIPIAMWFFGVSTKGYQSRELEKYTEKVFTQEMKLKGNE